MTTTRFFLLPAGEYVICDPCYALSDADYARWLNHSRCQEAMEGEYPRDTQMWLDAGVFVALSTQYGDGTYSSSVGIDFDVDSGTIACMPVAAVGKKIASILYKKFEMPFECYRDDEGTLHFGDVQIDTGYEETYNERD